MPFTLNAVTVERPAEVKLPTEYGTVYTKQQIENLVNKYADLYKVSKYEMMSTLECESHFKNVQSNHVLGGVREDSWGIAQINGYWHPEVSRQEAMTPEFAVEFMAKQFSKGKAYEWTCWKTNFQG